MLPFLVFAQDDYLANDPIWTVGSVCNISFTSPGCIANDVFNYQLDGDSIINGTTYDKVVQKGQVSYMWQGGPPPLPPQCTGEYIHGPAFVGLIRQVGYTILQWDGTMDRLLYDFDLSVGETLPVTMNNPTPDITVAAIDEVLIGTQLRKRFTLANSDAEYLIEGIGNSHGLFESIPIPFECSYSLECFGLGTMAYYPMPGPNCSLALATPSIVVEQPRVSLSPNPVQDELAINVFYGSFTGTVRLIDTQGREVLQVPMTGSWGIIDLAHVPNGAYLIVLGEVRQRMVVAH